MKITDLKTEDMKFVIQVSLWKFNDVILEIH